MNPRDVELPKALRSLPKDQRGYPIPFIVLRDRHGNPHFTINDDRKVRSCITLKKCSICGRRIDGGFWFIGGPKSFFHPNGAFIDPPLHEECGRYALQVCPFLGAPKYTGRIDAGTLQPGDMPDHVSTTMIDTTMEPGRPTVFCFGRTESYGASDRGSIRYLFPAGWTHYEFWSKGVQLPMEQGMKMVTDLGLTAP